MESEDEDASGDDAEGAPVADGSLTSFLRATVNDKAVLDKLNALLKGIKISLKDLLVKEKGSIAIDIALAAITNLSAILGLLGEKPGDKIPNIPSLADLAHGALYSLTHDVNELSDRASSLTTGLVDPDWKPGSAGGDGGNNGNGGGSGTSGNGGTPDGGASKPAPSSKKPTSGALPQTGDSASFVSMALLGLGALAGAFKASLGSRGEDQDAIEG